MRSSILKVVLVTFSLTGINVLCCFGQNHNQELAELYRADQADRHQIGTGNIDFDFYSQMMSRDSARLVRVYQLLDSNKVATGQDYYHAAMICQHGHDIRDSDSAVSFMRKAIELDSTVNKWLLAAAIDRNLVRRGKPQIYGTQFLRDENGVWSQPWMDTTVISDEERKRFGVETLEQQRQKLRDFQKTSLFKLLDELQDINKVVSFCRKEWLNKDKSEYNLSETEFNDLGYHFMSQSKYSEAYIIFQLNTELYPSAFNTYDSLGECLLRMGKVTEGLSAYRKSLELNPQNTNARNVLSAH